MTDAATDLVDVERRTWRHRIRMAWVITVCLMLLNLCLIALTSWSVLKGLSTAPDLIARLTAMASWDMLLVGAFMGFKVWADWRQP